MKRVFVGWDEFVVATRDYDELTIYSIFAARENLEDIKEKS